MKVRGVALVSALTFVIVAACDGRDPETAPRPLPTAAPAVEVVEPGWRRLPAGPLSARHGAQAFWTGREVVVVGGSDGPPCPPNADCTVRADSHERDGAAFDPRTGRWRTIASAPIPTAYASGVVVRGDVHLLVTAPNATAPEQHLLAYRPRQDRWVRLPAPPPAEGGMPRSLVAAGPRLVATTSSDERGSVPDLVYDTAARAWTALPDDPLGPSIDRSLVWTGRELVLAAIPLASFESPGSRPAHYQAAAYDVAAKRWRRLPDSAIVGYGPSWYRLGDLVVNPTLGPTPTGETISARGVVGVPGGILDPSTGEWSRLPVPPLAGVQDPHRFLGITAAGRDVVVNGQGWSFDVRDQTWTVVPQLEGGPRQDVAATWAAAGLFVFGGASFTRADGTLTSTAHGDAWLWTPPAPAGS